MFQSLDSYLKGAKLRFKELFDSYDRTRKGYLSITVSMPAGEGGEAHLVKQACRGWGAPCPSSPSIDRSVPLPVSHDQELRSLIKELLPSVAEGDMRYFQV